MNNDGFLDVFVGSYPNNSLYLNNGNGTFRQAINFLPIEITPARNSNFADIDNDGDLDLFTLQDLLLNDGKGRFAPINFSRALQFFEYDERYLVYYGHSLKDQSSAISDMDNDGDVDLFISEKNRLFVKV